MGKNQLKKVERTDLPTISGNIQHMTQLLMAYRKLDELVFMIKSRLVNRSLH